MLSPVILLQAQNSLISDGEIAKADDDRAGGGYYYWRDVAVNLAKLPADKLLSELQRDPFGTQAFEAKLLQAESKKGSLLDPSELRNLFVCPPTRYRITLPDARNHTTLTAFRNKNDANQKSFTFIFFQHLRKAGGTTFCKLAGDNLPTGSVPPYFCMPDFQWQPQIKPCAGCLGRWNNSEIVRRMQSQGHRIAGNEWDAFDPSRFFKLPAVFATIFRRPLDRAISQFRFECIEDRGCKQTNITKWWEDEKGFHNVYTWTFTKLNRFLISNIYRSGRLEDCEKRGSLVGQALDTLSQFHLILVMEWLGYSSSQVESILGFSNTSLLTHRVRPRVNLYARNDGQDLNRLGAGGVGLASWNPKDYLSPQQYSVMSVDLALDMILNEAARRMFLERMVCANN
jgi:hypothetical protein